MTNTVKLCCGDAVRHKGMDKGIGIVHTIYNKNDYTVFWRVSLGSEFGAYCSHHPDDLRKTDIYYEEFQEKIKDRIE